MSPQTIAWTGFALFVVAAMVIDLGVIHRKAHVVGMREALAWSAFWIGSALVFNVIIFFWHGKVEALEFLTGYLIELSLSVDNLFVFLVIFAYFRVPAIYQHKVLFWGILGALVMRAIFITFGIALIARFEWIIYIFGAFLIFTGVKMAFQEDKEIHPERNPLLKLLRKIMPVTPDYVDGRFFVRQAGKLFATPLFVVIIMVEATDLMFAVDSVPAILSITQKPFIVYTSNVFAIMGLRTFYFALAGLMNLFHFLHYGLAVILVFVGIKMVMANFYHLPVAVALGVVVSVLAISIIASLIWPKKKAAEAANIEIRP